MKKKSFIVLLVLILGTIHIWSISTPAQDISIPPAPVFDGVNNTGIEGESRIYTNNTALTIEYNADRKNVDGLILLGSGSGLTNDVQNTDSRLNFTKVDSERDRSFYEVDLVVYEYTYFYAYAWYGSIDNGTAEELSIFGDAPGHQLWIFNATLYPEFVESGINATLIDENYYAPLNSEVSIEYRVQNNVNDAGETATLVLANSEEEATNVSAAFDTIAMDRVGYEEIGDFNYSIFNTTFQMDRAIIYFTAFNDVGFERIQAEDPLVHTITNGFSVNTTFSDIRTSTSDIDFINFNVTTFNETNDMSIGFRYRVFENSSVDDPLFDWIETEDLASVDSELVNNSLNGITYNFSTAKETYNVSIGETFETDNVVEIQVYVRYQTNYNTSSNILTLTILSSKPVISFLSANETITNSINGTISFEISNTRGDITSATLRHILPNTDIQATVNVIDDDNYNASFTFTNGTIIQGDHTFEITVENSVGVSVTESLIYYLDETPPTIENLEETGNSADGIVTISFSFQDEGGFNQGVAYATLSWGNNVTINVTGLDEASFQYTKSDTYTITLTVFDKAGNIESLEIEVTVNIPEPTTTPTNGAPLSIGFLLGSFAAATAITTLVRKRR